MSSQKDEKGANQEEQRSTDDVVNQVQQDPHIKDSAPEEQRLSPDDEIDDVSYRSRESGVYFGVMNHPWLIFLPGLKYRHKRCLIRGSTVIFRTPYITQKV